MDDTLGKKLPRSLVIANNWKRKEINNILLLKNEMLRTNLDHQTIDNIINEKYNDINKQYNEKIKKYEMNQEKIRIAERNKQIKLKKKKAIQFLLSNKLTLEEQNVNPEYIKNYVERQYRLINETFTLNNHSDDDVDFID